MLQYLHTHRGIKHTAVPALCCTAKFGGSDKTMNQYTLFTDSATDLSVELIREMGVEVVPLRFHLGNQEYKNYPDDREMSNKEFYKLLRSGQTATTSQVNQADWMQAFQSALDQGRDVLCLAFSSGLSGTYQAATLAAQELAPLYPERTIQVIDTLQASMGEGLLVYHTACMKNDGYSLAHVADWVEQNKDKICAWFTVDDLMFLKRGGRVSGAAAVAGTLLGIKPVLHIDLEGHLIPMEKVRGRKASLDALVKHFSESNVDLNQQVVFLSHSDCAEDCEYVEHQIASLGVKKIFTSNIGPVIGAHTGPGTVALFFSGQNR